MCNSYNGIFPNTLSKFDKIKLIRKIEITGKVEKKNKNARKNIQTKIHIKVEKKIKIQIKNSKKKIKQKYTKKNSEKIKIFRRKGKNVKIQKKIFNKSGLLAYVRPCMQACIGKFTFCEHFPDFCYFSERKFQTNFRFHDYFEIFIKNPEKIQIF